ncbi:MAG: Nucleoid occlusion factor SlmA [Elusimicrobia bacterium]|nr:Nucleoid occlusion factor SlmA [Elusimicrobiota bacterium]
MKDGITSRFNWLIFFLTRESQLSIHLVMKTIKRTRISNEERRRLILKTARELFAQSGLEGARTADLARRAGVSERLLYLHFPSKEALFEAALKSFSDEVIGAGRRIISLEPSTSTLVLLTHFFMSQFLADSPERDDYIRLSLRSMASDGKFIRFVRKQAIATIQAKFQKCVEAAASAGDLPKNYDSTKVAGLLVEAVVAGVKPWLLPKPPVVDFGMDREQLIEVLVRFGLRGLGLSEEAIQRHYNPKALALLAG